MTSNKHSLQNCLHFSFAQFLLSIELNSILCNKLDFEKENQSGGNSAVENIIFVLRFLFVLIYLFAVLAVWWVPQCVYGCQWTAFRNHFSA